eukprot:TRINITY_DN65350_c0_g1_i1.p1 TRINITY_DN65350_c0_g1~~TRINITY_DN65350_c0_g1_i1.p1  ORF type:complete len:137 (+),score=28.47 TRINITY_DN65350_c0_g1_i1:68-478(+)
MSAAPRSTNYDHHAGQGELPAASQSFSRECQSSVPHSSSAGETSFVPPLELQRILGSSTCCICLELLYGKALTITVCGHAFHQKCLAPMQQDKCPQCRQLIDPEVASVPPELSGEELADQFIMLLGMQAFTSNGDI